MPEPSTSPMPDAPRPSTAPKQSYEWEDHVGWVKNGCLSWDAKGVSRAETVISVEYFDMAEMKDPAGNVHKRDFGVEVMAMMGSKKLFMYRIKAAPGAVREDWIAAATLLEPRIEAPGPSDGDEEAEEGTK